ncbi:hypothetical protein HIM_00661 [Hirsutella minnesotensis 3608]|nr:hypothetical protein HIM_00661 [Hirsutella minnesotensis 3608]
MNAPAPYNLTSKCTLSGRLMGIPCPGSTQDEVMESNGNDANVFAVPDFWQTSKWLQQVTEHASPLFFSSAINLERGDAPKQHTSPEPDAGDTRDQGGSGLLSLGPVVLERDGFFKLPAPGLDGFQRDEEPAHETEDADCASLSSVTNLDDMDIWTDIDQVPDPKVGFRTWDAFGTGDFAAHSPLFVSEAGPAVFDALLRRINQPVEFKNSDVPIVQTRPYLSSLLALALGRDSVFFRKEGEANAFKPALPKLRISGYSHHALQGIERQALRCGMTFLQIDDFVKDVYARDASRCEVALASSLHQVLQAVEQRLAVNGMRPRSLLILQSSIKEISSVLSPLRRLVSRLRKGSSDQDILTFLFHMASSLDDSDGFARVAVREILRRVSAPWIELMEEWIGTRRELGSPLTRSREGERKGFIKVEAETHFDDFGRQVEEVDFRLDHGSVPEFMPGDLVETIFETGRNLRFIRTFHPKHPLAQHAMMESMHPPKAEWLFDWASIIDLEERVTQYRDALQAALRESRRNSAETEAMEVDEVHPDSTFQFDFLGLDQGGMEGRMLASMNYLDQPVSMPKARDSLDEILHEQFWASSGQDTNHADATPHWSLLPLLSFGGIASAQSRIVNRESLRLLFDAHDIYGHFRLQRDFHLFGNGMFCSRLSHALFDPELDSAERQAGVANQGGVMGLRLGRRDTWPPASSELRLVLMGVLTETYDSRVSPGFNGGAGRDEAPTLPGDLSFAVRDLSSEEIDKCMDPDSLEALDFLRLAYATPQELSAVITPVHLMHYDRVFKHLLRLLRMQYVTNQLCLGISVQKGDWSTPSSTSCRFAREAHHFVSNVASYFLDTGVAIPWQMFMRKLAQVRADLQEDKDGVKLQSPDRLRELHSEVLEHIMFTLFLRKRQQPVLKLLEDLFGVILVYAKHLRLSALDKVDEAQTLVGVENLYADFKKKVQIFITVCRGMSEKGRAGGQAFEELGVGENSLVAQLLLRLDIGGFYVK